MANSKPSESRRVLICGDVNGKLDKLYGDVRKLQDKHGAFDFLLCTGRFLPIDKNPEFQEYVKGQKEIPIETYFIDSESSTFCSHCTSDMVPLGKTGKIFFLGTHGVKDIKGVRVAHLCGKKPVSQEDFYARYRNKKGEPAFGSNYYNSAVIEHLKKQKGVGIDILLTSEWPAHVLEGTDQPPQIEHSSDAIADLADYMEPRFHACALANRFLRRQPYLSSMNRYVCRLIGLGVFDKSEGQASAKAIHALIVCPFEKAKATLFKDSDQATPSPFLNMNAPDPDKWFSRQNGDLTVRVEGETWQVSKSIMLSSSSSAIAYKIEIAESSGADTIDFKADKDVVTAFLQFLYRKDVEQKDDPMLLAKLMIFSDREECEVLAEECSKLLAECGDFPTAAQIVDIMRLLKANRQLNTVKRWYTRLRDEICKDQDLLDAIIEGVQSTDDFN